MVIIIRANGIFASRISKYVHYYKENNIIYKVVGWDRLQENISLENYVFFKYKSKYVQGGIKAIIDRYYWMKFILKLLYKYRKQVKVIHACDVDTAFPSAIFKIIIKPRVKVIFDVCDWHSASNNNKSLSNYLINIMEFICIKLANEVILCEPERIQQIPYKLNKEHLILRNIPYFNDTSFLSKNEEYTFKNKLLTFSYVGWFGKGRFLDELLDAAEKGLINLLIAGFGNSYIEKRCLNLKTLLNIIYYGKVDYKKGLNIMYNSDLIYAMYCKTIPNHFYAAPNKYYEAMFLGKPILTTKGIILEKKVINNNIGYAINESHEDLVTFIKMANIQELNEKGSNARKLWDSKYYTYTSEFFKNDYSKIFDNERI